MSKSSFVLRAIAFLLGVLLVASVFTIDPVHGERILVCFLLGMSLIGVGIAELLAAFGEALGIWTGSKIVEKLSRTKHPADL